jgi:ribosome-binding factor A
LSNQRDYPRAARLNTQLREELSQLLRSGLIHDPRVAGVDLSVTSVDTTPDLSQAHIWISSLADDATLAKAVQGLNHAAGKLRHEVGLRLHIRYVPVLRFVVDEATREGDRITALIRKAREEDEAHAAARGEKPDAPG